MSRAIVGPDAAYLSDEDFGAALAELGNLEELASLPRLGEHPRHLWEYWRLPGPVERARLEAAAARWRKQVGERGESCLHVSDPTPFEPTWLIEALKSAPGVSAVSLWPRPNRLREWLARPWDWPLDVGVFGDGARALLPNLRGLEWERFLCLHDAATAGTKLDLLLHTGTLPELLRDVLAGPALPEVHSALALGGVGAIRDAESMLMALRAETQAVVAGALKVAPEDLRIWLDALLETLSHNEPLDVALFQPEGLRAAPIVVGDPHSFDAATASGAARRLATRLSRLPERAPPPASVPAIVEKLGLDRASGFAGIGASVLARVGHLQWTHESAAATDVAELHALARPALAVRAPRFLQGRLRRSGDDEALGDEPLARETAHALDVLIAGSRDGWTSALTSFPDDLPREPDGHRLTVVFVAPGVLKEPQVQPLWLPRDGDSGVCTFGFAIPPAAKALDARVTVLYRGRILQTLKVRAGVAGEEGAVPRSIALEAVVNAGLSGLDGRPAFASALLFNDTEGEPGMSAFGRERAAYVRLTDLSDFIKRLRARLEQITRTPADYATTEGEKSRELLVALARSGSGFVRSLRELPGMDAVLPAPEATGQRIQLLSVHPDDLVPLEYAYDGPSPVPTARLCDGWREGLRGGPASHGCAPTDQHVCPLRFWGMRHTIERALYDRMDATRIQAAAADAQIRSEALDRRPPLAAVRNVLFGAAHRARSFDAAAFDSAVDRMGAALGMHHVGFATAEDWDGWTAAVQSGSPEVLVLVTHTDEVLDELTLELGTTQRDASRVDGACVQEPAPVPPSPGPVVLLLGCRTATEEVPFSGAVAAFRRANASVILATMSTVRGRHVISVAERVVDKLVARAKGAPTRVGDFVAELRRTLLAEDLPVGLALVAYGDIDWQLGGDP